MICPHCRQNSQTAGVCSSCRQPLPVAPPVPTMPPPPPMPQTQQMRQMPPGQPTQTMPPAYQQATQRLPPGAQPTVAMPPPAPLTQQRVSLTGEVIEVAVAPPASGPALHPGSPSGYGGAGYYPETIRAVVNDGPTPGERWEKFLAFGFPILAAAMLVTHFAPNAVLWVALGSLLLISIAMSGTRAIPSYDDSVAECGVGLALALFFGPLIAGIALIVWGLVKQEANSAVISLLLLPVFIQIVLGFVLRSNPDAGLSSYLALFGLFNIFGMFAVLVGYAGWMIGNFFRPVGEF